MELDVMVGTRSWAGTAELARSLEEHGVSGMVFVEMHQTPWISIATAAQAAPSLSLATGIAVAFARSPMTTALQAWEVAANTGGRFRLGLGSQVRAHVERRFGAAFDPPGPRLRDYVEAVKACFRAFAGEPLAHHGPFYDLTLLPDQFVPVGHDFGDIKVDVSAVGPWMCEMAGEVADGVHVHPFHSLPYLRDRLLPSVHAGAAKAGRDPTAIDLLVPVFAVPGDTPEERAALREKARAQIAFYGSTRNYSFQFDDLGFEGTSARLNQKLKAGDMDGFVATITDEMLEHFAVVAAWDDMADELIKRYSGTATRLVSYLAVDGIDADPSTLPRWGEIARAVRAASASAATRP